MASGRRLRSERAARAALERRPDVRAAARFASELRAEVRAVGGAVRDAFLGRAGGDLDLAAHPAAAMPLAEALARAFGTRAVPLGRPGARVIRIAGPEHEVDVWEIEGSFAADRDRRDFTVNALGFALPSWTFDAPPGALDDLARRRLRLPRPGVLLEDPLRVLRAARFCAELPGFAVSREALPELREAAPRLARVAPERRLAEWDRILAAPPRRAAAAAAALERWGALAPLLPRSTAAQRRRGIARVARLPRGASPVAGRLALLAPLGERALSVLDEWKAARDERRLAAKLASLPPRADAPPSRLELARAVRALDPFVPDAAAVLASSPRRGERLLASALRRLTPEERARMVSPPRPLASGEVAALLGVAPGPPLGRALNALDEALAARLVRSAGGARRFLERLRPEGR